MSRQTVAVIALSLACVGLSAFVFAGATVPPRYDHVYLVPVQTDDGSAIKITTGDWEFVVPSPVKMRKSYLPKADYSELLVDGDELVIPGKKGSDATRFKKMTLVNRELSLNPSLGPRPFKDITISR